jgi:hypothetical protein
MLSSMRAGIKIAIVLMSALVVLLWVAANTSAIPIIRAAITVIPPPPPKAPGYAGKSPLEAKVCSMLESNALIFAYGIVGASPEEFTERRCPEKVPA